MVSGTIPKGLGDLPAIGTFGHNVSHDPIQAAEQKIRENTELYAARLRLTWYQTAINLAFDFANYRSEDPYTQVGACVIKKKGFEIGLGYNGPPGGKNINWRDRNAKNQRVIHAEENVLECVEIGEGQLMAVTHLPCASCIKSIARKQIPIVIYTIVIPKYNPELTFELANEFGIRMVQLKPTTKNAPETLEYISKGTSTKTTTMLTLSCAPRFALMNKLGSRSSVKRIRNTI